MSVADEPVGQDTEGPAEKSQAESEREAVQALLNEYFALSREARNRAYQASDTNEIIAVGWDNVSAQWAQTGTLLAIHNELAQITHCLTVLAQNSHEK